MYKVLLTVPYVSPESLFQQTSGKKGVVGEYHFFINDYSQEYDYWIVLDNVPESSRVKCRVGNVILFALESPSINRYSKRFTDQFDVVVSCQTDIDHKNLVNDLTTTFWFVHRDFDQLVNIKPFKKDRKISVITSNKTHTEGHKMRLEFVQRLKADLGDAIDLYGRGIKDFKDKWDVIAPYKFSIVIENESYSNWLTEKFCDCLLSYTYPVYFGCPNAESYFDARCFTRIDIADYEASLAMIKMILNENEFYDKKINDLQKAREKFLYQHNFFYKAIDIISTMEKKQSERVILKVVRSQDFLNKPVYKRLIKNILEQL